jgi:hypothetical protein
LKICNYVFAGGRTADEIVSWVLKKTGPVAKDLTSVDDAKGFVDASNVAVVGFFKVILIITIINSTANGLSPGGSGYYTYTVHKGEIRI